MANADGDGERAINRLLEALPRTIQRRLEARLEQTELLPGSTLHRTGTPIRRIYFINRGFVSVMKSMQDGRSVEIGTYGNSDIIGVFRMFGIEKAIWDTVVRIRGTAYSVDPGVLRSEWDGNAAVRDIVERYTFYLLTSFAQNAACHRLHPLKKRMCRWLLTAQDNTGSETLPLTHESLALSLGVQRSGASLAASALQKAGAIHNGRGHIVVRDRDLLRANACECYEADRRNNERLFNPARGPQS
ncbi:MAG TPA: Crp/Fnr family transcriptional regulator [Rhizomicrobium sp.]|nr:Crp/Fnr family transcriptional regulator [Rhizomicrobium sp.]